MWYFKEAVERRLRQDFSEAMERGTFNYPFEPIWEDYDENSPESERLLKDFPENLERDYLELTNNNTKNKPMNFIQQAQLKKFTESTKVEQLTKAIETAEENSALFAQVSARLADTAIRLQDDVALLNHYADHNEIASLEALMEVVEDKIEAIETSALSEITTELGELFGITKQAKLSKEEKKKEAMKSLGLV